jgi:hypothetical protein
LKPSRRRAGGVGQVLEHLPHKREALSSKNSRFEFLGPKKGKKPQEVRDRYSKKEVGTQRQEPCGFCPAFHLDVA